MVLAFQLSAQKAQAQDQNIGKVWEIALNQNPNLYLTILIIISITIIRKHVPVFGRVIRIRLQSNPPIPPLLGLVKNIRGKAVNGGRYWGIPFQQNT